MLVASERLAPGIRVLFVHAPYPGISKFSGEPTSLLNAITPLIEQSATGGTDPRSEVAVYDPDLSGAEFYCQLEEFLHSAEQLRVVGISTSTAAIEETRSICATVRRVLGSNTLLIVGGPHEDDVNIKTAARLDDVDISIGGDAEFILADIVNQFLDQDLPPSAFCRQLLSDSKVRPEVGSITLTSPWASGMKPIVRAGRPITGDDLRARARFERPANFSVFDGAPTHQLMVSRGCSYGKCTFCAEATQGGSTIMSDVAWLKEVIDAAQPGDALYFQDSIFPLHASAVKNEVLPLLRDSGLRWGCQVFLAGLSMDRIRTLEAHGCEYVYTGLESGVQSLRADVGKLVLNDDTVASRFRDLASSRMNVGVSVMFGALAGPAVRETPETVKATMDFARWLVDAGVKVVGFYPNVQTLLPGTPAATHFPDVDFYSMPAFDEFHVLEDGGIGYNFATIDGLMGRRERDELVEAVVRGSLELRKFGGTDWPEGPA